MYPSAYWWHGGWWFMWIIPVGFLNVLAVPLLRDGSEWWRDRNREQLAQRET